MLTPASRILEDERGGGKEKGVRLPQHAAGSTISHHDSLVRGAGCLAAGAVACLLSRLLLLRTYDLPGGAARGGGSLVAGVAWVAGSACVRCCLTAPLRAFRYFS